MLSGDAWNGVKSFFNLRSVNTLIVVERKNGVSIFNRLDKADFQTWLEDYSVGELWEKNILGGRP